MSVAYREKETPLSDSIFVPSPSLSLSLSSSPATSKPSIGFSHIVHELMTRQIRDILLISSPYSIFNFEEDGNLEDKLINEYNGLHLGYPPRITGAASAEEAFWLLKNKSFDMVILAPHANDSGAAALGREIKKFRHDIPVILLAHGTKGLLTYSESSETTAFDNEFIWSGSPDLLLSMIKITEDHLNVDNDTQKAGVRVLLLVEDSPEYYSYFLPVIYKEIVSQTQALLNVGLNEKIKLLTMRTRPKILLARNFEEAVHFYHRYRSFLLGVISDTRLPREGKTDPAAGVTLLSRIRKDIPELPLLLMSAESDNQKAAVDIPAVFMDKNASNLSREIHNFFLPYLGFGDFVFRTPDGREICRAENLCKLEAMLANVPDESILYHAAGNHFSAWLMARAESDLALKFRSVKLADFKNADEIRQYLISSINHFRTSCQQGIISKFNHTHFDATISEFSKIGHGSLGGKARGIAFMGALLRQHAAIASKYPKININMLKTLVICTDVVDAFVRENNLADIADSSASDAQIAAAFEKADLPDELLKKLKVYLSQVTFPLAIRASRQQEDTFFDTDRQCGHTCMIPNNQSVLSARLAALARAIKRVCATTYFATFSTLRKNSGNQPFNESMAIMIQQLAGGHYGDYFYPAVSGSAASYNYYPFSHMKPEDGIVRMALGFGGAVLNDSRTLRFSPKYPTIFPQFSSVQETLNHSQRYFYALKINGLNDSDCSGAFYELVKREVDESVNEFPVQALASTYLIEENRIRDTFQSNGTSIMTLAPLLKYDGMGLSGFLCDLLEIGQKGLGCPVEIDFSLQLDPQKPGCCDFSIVQIRPMSSNAVQRNCRINESERQEALCFSNQALGNGVHHQLKDVVYVKPETFRPDQTPAIAEDLKKLNDGLVKSHCAYLLMGPGRWGTSDRWLGIPVSWRDISGAGAIIELRNEQLKVDPSRESHFFNHITSKGIPYITIDQVSEKPPNGRDDYFDWTQIHQLPTISETAYVRHVRFEQALKLKIDGKNSQCVINRG